MTTKKNLVVIGNGMVGHKFLELMVEKKADQQYNLITFCEESRVAYDRVHLSEYFSGRSAEDLSLVESNFYQDNNIEIYIGDKAVKIDRANKTITSEQGKEIKYDKLICLLFLWVIAPGRGLH